MGYQLKYPGLPACYIPGPIGHRAFVFILPYIEGGAQFNAYNIVRAYYTSSNLTAIANKVSSYICPSDTVASPDPTGKLPMAQGSYGTSRGLYETLASNWANANKAPPDPTGQYYSTCNQGPGDGMFSVEFSHTIASVTDGLSNTFLFGEMSRFKNEPPGSNFMFNLVANWFPGPPWGGNLFWPNDSRPTSGATCVPKLNAPADTTGTVIGQCFAGCSYPPDWIKNQACQNLGQFAFRSLHPGGANFAMGDGSVRFIKESIDLATYRKLATRAGNEVVSADQY